mgnify:CR=1 FL=1
MVDFSGFYKLPIEERIKRIASCANLSESETEVLKNAGGLGLAGADRMSENVVGATHLPFALGLNFKINGKEFIIPMAIEEPSVVAAASNGAKLCLPEGFSALADEPVMTGQIQIVGLANAVESAKKLEQGRKKIEEKADALSLGMKARGGGYRGMETRVLGTSRGEMLVVYFHVDVRDAMGANTINTLLEEIAPALIECLGEGKTRAKILTNLADRRLVKAGAVWKKEIIGEETIEAILDIYEFAKNDIYRAATHNKGIMNGIDAVVLATGNDWRAVEAGAHAYAARSGKYMPLTHYEKDSNGNLVGSIELPMALGTVGGSISSNPIAKIGLKILGNPGASELAMAAACAGLANNFAALRAIGSEGIQKGHMKLQAKNLAAPAGANGTGGKKQK